jgi:3-hydroxyisobutyrate dehydrogenase-like beta-hydroxyacid dehydrogenase
MVRMLNGRWSHGSGAPSVEGMTNLAVLGTGRMGTAIAIRLIESGHRVTVWNRHRGRTADAAAKGATVAGTPAEAVAGAELVITMLVDGPAVEEVVAGALRPGVVLVQMSTIGPAETAAIAAGLPVDAQFVDAPVGGSVDAAAGGALTIFVGAGPGALERVEPVLRQLGTVRRCGDVGAGTAAKLMLNTAMLTALGALHDTLAVAGRLGVEREVALELLGAGPLGVALRRATSTTADFAISLAAKDLRLAGAGPALDATLRLLGAAPDQDADIATLFAASPR